MKFSPMSGVAGFPLAAAMMAIPLAAVLIARPSAAGHQGYGAKDGANPGGCMGQRAGHGMPGGYAMPPYGWQRPMRPGYGHPPLMTRPWHARPPGFAATVPTPLRHATDQAGATGRPGAAAADSAREAATVTIRQMQFQPRRVTIGKGGTVTWEQQSNVPHNVTAADGDFGSETLGNGATFSQTFDEPGTYRYQCGIHPSMRGEVVVVEQ